MPSDSWLALRWRQLRLAQDKRPASLLGAANVGFDLFNIHASRIAELPAEPRLLGVFLFGPYGLRAGESNGFPQLLRCHSYSLPGRVAEVPPAAHRPAARLPTGPL